MDFEKMLEEIMVDKATTMLENVFLTMFDRVKEAGGTSLGKMLPSISPESQQKAVEKAWEQALSKAIQKEETKRSQESEEFVELSHEEFLALLDGIDDSPQMDNKETPSFPMTKEEFCELSAQQLADLARQAPQAVSPYEYDSHPYRERAEQSKLNKLGYSVAQGNGMSGRQRQELLAHLISTHQVSKGYVISCLEHLITINGKKEANELAVRKWKADLAYVKSL